MNGATSPVQSMILGAQQGQQMRQRSMEMAVAKQIADRQNKMNQDVKEFALNKNRTFDDFQYMMNAYPQYAQQYQMSFGMMKENEKEIAVSRALPVWNYLVEGKPDKAIELLEIEREAKENSGLDEEAQKTALMIQSIKESPEDAVVGTEGTLFALMGDGFNDIKQKKLLEKQLAVKSAKERSKIKRDMIKASIEGGLKQAQALKVLKETEKLGIETQKAALELKRLEETGGVDPKTKFNQEEKIRKEYQSRTKGYQESKDALNKISVSAKDRSGASDTALIFSFMKMLDPGSVVRETEFSQAQNTAGLLTTLLNLLTKVESGEFLTDAQRKKFAGLAQKYMTASEKEEIKKRKGYDKLIKDYKLDREHIFGERTGITDVVEPPTLEGSSGSRKLTTTQQKQAERQIQSVTTQEQYDALPSGAIYIEDGKRYRKP